MFKTKLIEDIKIGKSTNLEGNKIPLTKETKNRIWETYPVGNTL